MAIENNPELKAQHKRYEASMEKVAQVTSLPDPIFSFGFAITPTTPIRSPQEARFSISQMLPWFGTLQAMGNSVELLAEANFQSYIDTRNQLYYQVSAAYYPLYELNELIRIEEDNIKLLESFKAIATQKFENGLGKLAKVLRTEILINEANINLVIYRKQEKPLVASFNQLLNRPEYEPVQINTSIEIENVQDFKPKDSLLIDNPALNALELKIQYSEATKLAVQKQSLPRIGVGLEYRLIGNNNQMNTSGNDMLMPMISISLPIYRKKYNALKNEAVLVQDSYVYEKEGKTNSLIADYEIALFDIQQQQQLISLYEQQVKMTEQSLNLLFASYGNSGEAFEEVLRMHQELLKYQKLNANAFTRYNIALAKINYLTAKED